MRFSPQLLDEIRARLPVSQVVARKVALKKKGREFAGLSPFKTEKTPSFFVNDQKGFYHCFASGEHGDIFTFLIKTEGMSFPEAVERLAEEAGVELPKERHHNPARDDERGRLLKLMQAAAEYFRRQLFTEAGREARDYLARRQLDDAIIETFELGYAPNSRNALKDYLAGAGFAEHDMVESGMLIAGEDIKTPYDRFRHRVIFPIQDAKGRIVAFGGRALDPGQPAKYLNSPETPLFHKGALLYNAHRARPFAFDNAEIIAVEGYMDAIALAGAGFPQCVAPLGTALTPEQLQLMWRMAPEPTLCFDGDSAGRKAAFRAIDTAVPILRPGYSLRFTFLPDGLDPDDLVRQQGPDAMRTLLSDARPLADVLWDREYAAGDWSTPERRAALEQSLRGIVKQITDAGVRSHYGQLLKERLENAWGFSRSGRSAGEARVTASRAPINTGRGRDFSRFGNRQQAHRPVERSSSLKQSALVAGKGHAIAYREALLVRTLINHPWLIDEFAEDIADLPLSAPPLERIRGGLLTLLASEIDLDSMAIRNQLERLRLSQDVDLVERIATHKSDRFAERDADRAEVEAGWRHTLALHNQQTLRDQLTAAEREFHATGEEDAMARIIEIQRLIEISTATEAHLED